MTLLDEIRATRRVIGEIFAAGQQDWERRYHEEATLVMLIVRYCREVDSVTR